ncbi:hypothetical protein [Helicobacter trogontum]|nr:hypothetical protein [Helicobacter trogontum]
MAKQLPCNAQMIQQHRQYLENILKDGRSVCGSYLYVIDELLEILNE